MSFVNPWSGPRISTNQPGSKRQVRSILVGSHFEYASSRAICIQWPRLLIRFRFSCRLISPAESSAINYGVMRIRNNNLYRVYIYMPLLVFITCLCKNFSVNFDPSQFLPLCCLWCEIKWKFRKLQKMTLFIFKFSTPCVHILFSLWSTSIELRKIVHNLKKIVSVVNPSTATPMRNYIQLTTLRNTLPLTIQCNMEPNFCIKI